MHLDPYPSVSQPATHPKDQAEGQTQFKQAQLQHSVVDHVAGPAEVVRCEQLLLGCAAVRMLSYVISRGHLPSILYVLDEPADAVFRRPLGSEADLFIWDKVTTLRHERNPS